jgi:stage II sporulation protein D
VSVRHRVAWVLCVAVIVGSCVPQEPPQEVAAVPAPVPGPEVRIGLFLDAAKLTLGGAGALRISDPDDGPFYEPPAQLTAEVSPRPAAVGINTLAGVVTRRQLVVEAVDSGGVVRVNGRDYRGALEIRRGVNGVMVINRLDLESYITGVVGAEMGRRAPGDEEALKAQAVVSRTYALRNKGRHADQGFDLLADVSDQAYAGVANENPMATAAVAATHGEILTYDGAPIDAFYFSTCSGRTEEGSAAFSGASRPYLRSIDDHDPAGVAWCASSPRYRWSETWTRAELSAILKRTLPANNLPGSAATDFTELRVLARTPSGRIATLELAGRTTRTAVRGQTIRRVLSPTSGGILRSNDFTVRLSRVGGKIERIDIDGRGNGHGVGMCQWGAVGRSRAGEIYPTILSSYFPGTQLQRVF